MAEVSRRIPWRNGGGTTELLAQSPGGEPVEWRISVAEIERDGAFSDYSGYDRTIVAEDSGFTLEFGDGERIQVEPLVPFTFAGDRAVFCRLHGSPATAFNVMTLRGAFAHEVRVENGEIEVTLLDRFAEGPAIAEACRSFDEWERERREYATWEALVKLRFAQNVRDDRAQAASATQARLAATTQRRDTVMKRRFLERERHSLEPRLGSHVFERWRQDVLAFDPAIEDQLAQETSLYNRYTRLTAAATYRVANEDYTAAGLSALSRSADRELRREAAACTWQFCEANAAALDRIFDDLVRVRTTMARNLGYPSYTDLAYVRLGRTDYGRAGVAQLRESIAREVIPLCDRIVRRQARDLGVETIMPWDELVFDRDQQPRSYVDPIRTQEALVRACSSAHPDLGAFARMLVQRALFDAEARPGKRSGAFCSFFPSLGMPHVFANCTGTAADVTSLVHETGHAFQDYSSRRQPVLEYVVPPAETGEVCSLGLEYLLWPFYGEFFGEAATRYRAAHLKTMLLMLPYIAAVDHFQELVYDNAGSAPAERYEFWRTVSQRYMPYRNTGGIPHLVRGGAWHRQHHIFGFPFYYIDYALALLAAFDLWGQSQSDYADAMNRYIAMARTGGALPFRTFLRAHGLADPLAEDASQSIVSIAAQSKELSLS